MEEKIESITKVTETSSMLTYKVKTAQTVRDILAQLKMAEKYFAVLINGRRGELTDVVDENSEIVILPKIAGG
jgi:sulfur carrier protein ThiS